MIGRDACGQLSLQKWNGPPELQSQAFFNKTWSKHCHVILASIKLSWKISSKGIKWSCFLWRGTGVKLISYKALKYPTYSQIRLSWSNLHRPVSTCNFPWWCRGHFHSGPFFSHFLCFFLSFFLLLFTFFYFLPHTGWIPLRPPPCLRRGWHQWGCREAAAYDNGLSVIYTMALRGRLQETWARRS